MGYLARGAALRRAGHGWQHRWHERRRSARSRVPVPDPAGRRRTRLDPRAAHGDHPRDERVPSRDDRPVAARDAQAPSFHRGQAPGGGGGGCRSDARNAGRDRRDGGHLARPPRRASRVQRGARRLRPRTSRGHACRDLRRGDRRRRPLSGRRAGRRARLDVRARADLLGDPGDFSTWTEWPSTSRRRRWAGPSIPTGMVSRGHARSV